MDSFEPGSYIPSKNFRKVLSTEAEDQLWNDRVLDDFYGHSRKGTRRRFYSVRDLDKMVPVFRSEVTAKVDQVLAEFAEQWRREAGEVLSLRPYVPGFVPGSGKKVSEGLS